MAFNLPDINLMKPDNYTNNSANLKLPSLDNMAMVQGPPAPVSFEPNYSAADLNPPDISQERENSRFTKPEDIRPAKQAAKLIPSFIQAAPVLSFPEYTLPMAAASFLTQKTNEMRRQVAGLPSEGNQTPADALFNWYRGDTGDLAGGLGEALTPMPGEKPIGFQNLPDNVKYGLAALPEAAAYVGVPLAGSLGKVTPELSQAALARAEELQGTGIIGEKQAQSIASKFESGKAFSKNEINLLKAHDEALNTTRTYPQEAITINHALRIQEIAKKKYGVDIPLKTILDESKPQDNNFVLPSEEPLITEPPEEQKLFPEDYKPNKPDLNPDGYNNEYNQAYDILNSSQSTLSNSEKDMVKNIIGDIYENKSTLKRPPGFYADILNEIKDNGEYRFRNGLSADEGVHIVKPDLKLPETPQNAPIPPQEASIPSGSDIMPQTPQEPLGGANNPPVMSDLGGKNPVGENPLPKGLIVNESQNILDADGQKINLKPDLYKVSDMGDGNIELKDGVRQVVNKGQFDNISGLEVGGHTDVLAQGAKEGLVNKRMLNAEIPRGEAVNPDLPQVETPEAAPPAAAKAEPQLRDYPDEEKIVDGWDENRPEESDLIDDYFYKHPNSENEEAAEKYATKILSKYEKTYPLNKENSQYVRDYDEWYNNFGRKLEEDAKKAREEALRNAPKINPWENAFAAADKKLKEKEAAPAVAAEPPEALPAENVSPELKTGSRVRFKDNNEYHVLASDENWITLQPLTSDKKITIPLDEFNAEVFHISEPEKEALRAGPFTTEELIGKNNPNSSIIQRAKGLWNRYLGYGGNTNPEFKERLIHVNNQIGTAESQGIDLGMKSIVDENGNKFSQKEEQIIGKAQKAEFTPEDFDRISKENKIPVQKVKQLYNIGRANNDIQQVLVSRAIELDMAPQEAFSKYEGKYMARMYRYYESKGFKGKKLDDLIARLKNSQDPRSQYAAAHLEQIKDEQNFQRALDDYNAELEKTKQNPSFWTNDKQPKNMKLAKEIIPDSNLPGKFLDADTYNKINGLRNDVRKAQILVNKGYSNPKVGMIDKMAYEDALTKLNNAIKSAKNDNSLWSNNYKTGDYQDAALLYKGDKENLPGKYLINKEFNKLKEMDKNIEFVRASKDSKAYKINPKTGLDFTYLKQRKDLPEDYRQLLGEIQEPGYANAKRFMQIKGDIVKGEFYKWIADEYASLKPRGIGARDVHFQGPKWGKLGKGEGMWVPEEYARQIKYFDNEMQQHEGLMNGLLDFFKESKTVWSPATHARNVMSNIANYWIVYGKNPLNGGVLKHFISHDAWYDMGLKANIYRSGIQQDLGQLLDNYSDLDRISPSTFAEIFGKIRQGARRVYNFEDSFFKLGAFKEELSRIYGGNPEEIAARWKGMTPQEQQHFLDNFGYKAAREAKDAIVSYDEIPETIRRYSRIPLIGQPFVSYGWAYTTRTLPKILRGGLPSLARFGLAVGAPIAINAYARNVLGIDAKKELLSRGKNFRSNIADYLWEKGFINDGVWTILNDAASGYELIPYKDRFGRRQYLETQYIFPWLQYSRLSGIENTFMPDPRATAFVQLLINRNFYSDKKIRLESDPPLKQAKDSALFITNALAPPIVPGGSSYNKLSNAIKGETDIEGRVKRTIPQVLLDTIAGVKITSVLPETVQATEHYELKKEYEDIEQMKRQSVNNKLKGLISEEKMQQQINDYNGNEQRIIERYKKFSGG